MNDMPDHPIIEAIIQAAMAVLSHDQEQASSLGRWEMAQLRRRFTAILRDTLPPAQIDDDGQPCRHCGNPHDMHGPVEAGLRRCVTRHGTLGGTFWTETGDEVCDALQRR